LMKKESWLICSFAPLEAAPWNAKITRTFG
jgi:hypothetical protein